MPTKKTKREDRIKGLLPNIPATIYNNKYINKITIHWKNNNNNNSNNNNNNSYNINKNLILKIGKYINKNHFLKVILTFTNCFLKL